jgi:threonine synthase
MIELNIKCVVIVPKKKISAKLKKEALISQKAIAVIQVN